MSAPATSLYRDASISRTSSRRPWRRRGDWWGLHDRRFREGSRPWSLWDIPQHACPLDPCWVPRWPRARCRGRDVTLDAHRTRFEESDHEWDPRMACPTDRAVRDADG